MKRVVLIAGGTVGGLGAVLSVTPPQLGDNGLSTLAGASASTSLNTVTATESAQAVATKKPTANASASSTTKKSATKKSTNTNKSTATTPKSTAVATATPVPTKAAISGVTGSFTGDAIDVGYGLMQVKITVANGKIKEAEIVQAPSGRNQRWTDLAVPNLRQQTLAAQSAAITGVSGASYTSYGWYKSLISALEKAGMPTGV